MATIKTWQPEDAKFWEDSGRKTARKNLLISVFALILAFIVWQIWSVTAVRLNDVGFNLSSSELFTLAALPGLSGATLRLVYTFMPGIMGGKNWTIISTLLLLFPTIGIGVAVQNPETPYYVLVILAAMCGLGGGCLSSSTATLGPFYPKKEKGTANGINVGVGNLGVSVVQFATPLVIGLSFIGSMTGGAQVLPDGSEVFIQNAAFVWVIPIIAAVLLAAFGMDNLPNTKQSVSSQLAVLGKKHTWIMTWLYVMCFGSFIGYSAAFPLLIKAEFPDINAAQLAFLGPFIGASFRPIGGWISDKVNSGAKVTFWVTLSMVLATSGVIYFLHLNHFAGFLTMFLILFAGTGLANGSTFRMVPFIFDAKQSGSVLGIIAALGAYGAFFIPKIFGWSIDSTGSADFALYLFVGYYAISLFVCWFWYSRKGAEIKC
ncbi:nitrate/nitrite transporter [Paenibacillus sambharensis]|uniref:Nitrate/nitrite transporter n=1 Tax=Paenibacillus sambharensis TaxID=1803190 RepID=A0A2W1LSH6_9BACL|nr:MFS transporter [Paenibacillus sambharensis]PZD94791.1 nitrate/nitrite transporter [Paenibacillus sambharensis]